MIVQAQRARPHPLFERLASRAPSRTCWPAKSLFEVRRNNAVFDGIEVILINVVRSLVVLVEDNIGVMAVDAAAVAGRIDSVLHGRTIINDSKILIVHANEPVAVHIALLELRVAEAGAAIQRPSPLLTGRTLAESREAVKQKFQIFFTCKNRASRDSMQKSC
jgi:hypothetical protein